MKIFFHIGAGKTGTSSIQRTLLNSDKGLQKAGVKYLGMMLENAPVKLFSWQKDSATEEFLKLEQLEAEKQVDEVLDKNIKFLEKDGVHTVVWSNEWFFGRHWGVLNPIKRLENAGHEVYVVGYVRRHDAWAKSAYGQWGVKHKTYKGNIVSFRDYIERRPVAFAEAFSPWAKFFGEKFVMRNFDHVGDVVMDFIGLLKVDKQAIDLARVNESPGNEELVLRAFFNDKQYDEVIPFSFERLFQTAHIDFKTDPVSWLNSLLPSEEDMKLVVESTKDDQEQVNTMLEERGQPRLNFQEKKINGFSINHNIAYSVLFQILERQAREINSLKNDVEILRERAGKTEG
ncbi:hypothetical protein [Salinicola salarius]|uniref:hypothetical protein n=1 Tax=Salinicola salarius TaxID=430457 RepID=UPI0013006F6A|nr:hypothetical protein [Salinicola salarius]